MGLCLLVFGIRALGFGRLSLVFELRSVVVGLRSVVFEISVDKFSRLLYLKPQCCGGGFYMLGFLIGPVKRNQSGAPDWFRLRLSSDAPNWFRCRNGFACASNSVSLAPQRNHSDASDSRRKRNQSGASDWFRLRLAVIARIGFGSCWFWFTFINSTAVHVPTRGVPK